MRPARVFGRRAVLALLAASPSLAGCGFEPLHASGRGADVTAALAEIRIQPIPDRSGQILRNYLLDRLTPRAGAVPSRYTLVVRLQEPRQTLALRRDDVISRVGYSATASFDLNDERGSRIFTGAASHSTDYEVTNSEFATLVSLQAARERVLELVSEDIRSQLAGHFARR